MIHAGTKLGVTVSVLAATVLVLASAGPASAAPSQGYATWTVDPGPAPKTGTLTLPAGFPATTLVSTSPSLPIAGGTSRFLPPDTPAGLLVGSSYGKPYISVSPPANVPGSVATTTFSFASPTPAGVWGAAFGDIDAERVTVSATDAAGLPVAAVDLGVSPFNYCITTTTPKPCGTTFGLAPLPTLTSTATSVEAADPLCPSDPAHCDTSGASIWVAPTVPLRTLTLTSTNNTSSSPAAQVWFASVARTVAGVVTLGTLPPVVVELIDSDGDVVTSTTSAADGSFTLPPVVPSADYRLRVDRVAAPDAPIVAVDVSAGDATGVALAASPAVVVAVPDPTVVPTLPDTGADSRTIAVVAASLLALGALGMTVGPIIRRVRRRRNP